MTPDELDPTEELHCDTCGVRADDWRRDQRAPVTFFIRQGLCCRCAPRDANGAPVIEG